MLPFGSHIMSVAPCMAHQAFWGALDRAPRCGPREALTTRTRAHGRCGARGTPPTAPVPHVLSHRRHLADMLNKLSKTRTEPLNGTRHIGHSCETPAVSSTRHSAHTHLCPHGSSPTTRGAELRAGDHRRSLHPAIEIRRSHDRGVMSDPLARGGPLS